MDQPTNPRRMFSNKIEMSDKSSGPNPSLREGDALLAKEDTKSDSAQEKTHLEVTITITSKYVQQIVEEGLQEAATQQPVVSMKTKTRLVAQPASCESRHIQVTFQGKDGQKCITQVLRSFVLRPVEQQEEQKIDEQIQDVPIMKINSNDKILKTVNTMAKRVFEEDVKK